MRSIDTPCGGFWCGADPQGRPACGWEVLAAPPDDLEDPPADWRLVARLAAWFEDFSARRSEQFDDLPLPEGTPFERRCWTRLRRTATGETISYGGLAGEIGTPAAARAVGGAMRRNPAPLIVPCHRVVAAGGRIGGYAGVVGRHEPFGKADTRVAPGPIPPPISQERLQSTVGSRR
ncbi:MAG: methylated-DNA--[protein]-cysteine S-methyltransferase [Planctomycetota bacterium]|jgi:O-6-methylguanine DNA methyltransferase